MSKVYFTDFRTSSGNNIMTKLEKLLLAAGFNNIDFENRFAVIKIHFGEAGNMAYLRPQYAKVVIDMVKARGGNAFLSDCNTLYVGARKQALEHMDTAYQNGYSPFSTGCHIIIGDGLKGTDDVEVPVNGGVYIKEAKIGQAIMDADVFISLTHFKGHEATGFGGTLKNIGMGSGSRRGKMEMHMASKPSVQAKKCRGCRRCHIACAQNAITYGEDNKASIDQDKCVGCGRCIGVCSFDAIKAPYDESNDILNMKIAEYAKAVVDGRPAFYISIVRDVTPHCDCFNRNDTAIIQDVGMFASFDPVSLDQACADACVKTPVIFESSLGDRLEEEHLDYEADADPFTFVNVGTNWKVALEHGEKIGLGSRKYELITIK